MLRLRLVQLILVYVGVALQVGSVSAQTIPENARPTPYGAGWTCVRGYYKSGDRCLKVELPENATLDYTGSRWACVRGYRKVGEGCTKVVIPQNAVLDYTGGNWTCTRGYRKSGDGCARVAVPENATLDYTGSNWTCVRGYRKSGEGCAKVVVPENATLDYTGSNWTCTRGYRKAGEGCTKVVVPENATLDYTGSNWTCSSGYKRVKQGCAPMTPAEAQRQRALEEKVRQRVAERQQRIARGEDCQTEYKTNAQVCVLVTRAAIECNESAFGSYYDDCDVVLNYDVKTNYAGGSSLSTDVQCKVEIDYSGQGTLLSSSDSQRKSDTHNLYAHSTLSERFRYNFSFGTFDKVTKARVTSVMCEVDSVNLW
jgi:hypothetical protein